LLWVNVRTESSPCEIIVPAPSALRTNRSSPATPAFLVNDLSLGMGLEGFQKLMRIASRSLPLRWLYPAVGAAVAAGGAILLSQLHAEPVLVTIGATVLFVTLGWLVGTKEDTLRETASTDPLTGVANRRSFDQRLARNVAEALRSGQPFTLLFVDV